jgi:hypothetical protein
MNDGSEIKADCSAAGAMEGDEGAAHPQPIECSRRGKTTKIDALGDIQGSL